jgi:hypothetical protein
VEDYLVPSGANFATDVAGTTEVTAAVKPQPRKPLPTRKHAARKASATPPQYAAQLAPRQIRSPSPLM